jgi:hypothetical protein
MKQKRYWLVGGFLFVGIVIIMTLIVIPFDIGGGRLAIPTWSISFLPGWALVVGLRMMNIYLDDYSVLSWIFVTIVSLLFYFIIGSVLGWVYEKVKNR